MTPPGIDSAELYSVFTWNTKSNWDFPYSPCTIPVVLGHPSSPATAGLFAVGLLYGL